MVTGREAVGERGAFKIVDAFEEAVARYTGAPRCVAVDSGTNALFLAFLWAKRGWTHVAPYCVLPRRTYVGVAQAARNAGFRVEWHGDSWQGAYRIHCTRIIDSAKRFTSGMYQPGTLTCVSFQAGKILPIGRGGAILTDSADFVRWAKRARFDGRTEGVNCDQEDRYAAPGYHMYLTPPDAARGLWLLMYLPETNPDQLDTYDDLSTQECFR